MFANHREEDEIYPLTTIEIAESPQKRDQRSTTSKILRRKKWIFVFDLLKTQKCYVKIINHSSQHLYGTGQSAGITTTSSTLATHVSKRRWDPWSTGKVYAIPSNHMMNLADLAK
jgi:hypothetical protein